MTTGLPDAVAAFLARHHVMTLATHGEDGPWAAAVFYAGEDASLYFLSSPSTRHGRHLGPAAHCAATIHDDVADWAQVRGVQLEGQARRLEGDAAQHALRLYGRKFPLLADPDRLPAAIAAALERVAWYRLDVEQLHFVDNGRGFGHRDSYDLR